MIWEEHIEDINETISHLIEIIYELTGYRYPWRKKVKKRKAEEVYIMRAIVILLNERGHRGPSIGDALGIISRRVRKIMYDHLNNNNDSKYFITLLQVARSMLSEKLNDD